MDCSLSFDTNEKVIVQGYSTCFTHEGSQIQFLIFSLWKDEEPQWTVIADSVDWGVQTLGWGQKRPSEASVRHLHLAHKQAL